MASMEPRDSKDFEIQDELRAFSESVSNDLYFAHFDVAFYLEDAIQQLILSPPKSESPLKALASYFDSVVEGSNVIRRSFKYVHATVLNRKAFVRHVLHALQPVVTPDTFTVKDISLMVGLLCDDFPEALFDAAVAVLGLESTDAPVEGGKALQAVLTLFMYTEFFSTLADKCTDSKLLEATSSAATTWAVSEDGASLCWPPPARTLAKLRTTLTSWPLKTHSAEWMALPLPLELFTFLRAQVSTTSGALLAPPLKLIENTLCAQPAGNFQQLCELVCTHPRLREHLQGMAEKPFRQPRSAQGSREVLRVLTGAGAGTGSGSGAGSADRSDSKSAKRRGR